MFNMSISRELIARFKAQDIPFFANDNIAAHISKHELAEVQDEVEDRVRELMKSLLIDVENDHNTKGTPKRVAKMFLHEVFKGRYRNEPEITSFPNAKHLDEMICVGPIDVKSACSHHLVPIVGHAYIGVIPAKDGTIIGLSKFNRVVEYFARRPQIQEELCVQIADFLEKKMSPVGIIVYIKAKHMCMSWRGVEQESWTTTTVARGAFKDNSSQAKAEFLKSIE